MSPYLSPIIGHLSMGYSESKHRSQGVLESLIPTSFVRAGGAVRRVHRRRYNVTQSHSLSADLGELGGVIGEICILGGSIRQTTAFDDSLSKQRDARCGR